jgi:hypothetical protein
MGSNSVSSAFKDDGFYLVYYYGDILQPTPSRTAKYSPH